MRARHNAASDSGRRNESSSPFEKITAQILHYVPGSILPALLTLASTSIYTRLFNSSEFGTYTLILSVVSLTTALASEWLRQAFFRYHPTAVARGEADQIKLGTAQLMVLVQIVIVATGVTMHQLFPHWQAFILPGMLVAQLSAVFELLTTVLRIELRAIQFTIFRLMDSIGRLGFGLVVVWAYRSPAGILWGAALSLALLLPFLWRQAGFPGLNRLREIGNLKHVKQVGPQFARYGFPMIVWFFTSTILDVGDRYVIQLTRGLSEVGVYAANVRLIQGAVGLAMSPISLAINPILIKAWADGDRSATERALGKIIQWSLIASCVMVMFAFVFSRDVGQILGPEFSVGYAVIPPAIGGLAVWHVSSYMHKPLEFLEKTGVMSALCGLTAITNMLLNLLLVPKWGYVAAAWTTLASCGIYMALVGVIGRKTIRWTVDWGLVIKVAASCTTGAVVISWLRTSLEQLLGYGPATLIVGLGLALTIAGGAIVLRKRIARTLGLLR